MFVDEEIYVLRMTQCTLERFCLPSGLEAPWNPLRRAGGSDWGDRSLGICAWTATDPAPCEADEDEKKEDETSLHLYSVCYNQACL